MKRLLSLCLVVCLLPAITACSRKATTKAITVSVDRSVKEFLDSVIPSEKYVLYALKEAVPVTMEDLKEKGLLVCGPPPENFFLPNISSALYGGGFLPGTIVKLEPKSDGIDKFGGIKINVAVLILPEGCVNSMRKEGGAVIMLIARDTKDLNTDGLVEVIFK